MAIKLLDWLEDIFIKYLGIHPYFINYKKNQVYLLHWTHLFMLVYPVPALRGKDYGKTKMRYPDYMETQSGLQYKVIIGK